MPPKQASFLTLQVNWQTLWKPRWQRSLREVLVLPLVILIMLVPLGLFTGGLPLAFFPCDAGPACLAMST